MYESPGLYRDEYDSDEERMRMQDERYDADTEESSSVLSF